MGLFKPPPLRLKVSRRVIARSLDNGCAEQVEFRASDKLQSLCAIQAGEGSVTRQTERSLGREPFVRPK